jgi:hypothetical protein
MEWAEAAVLPRASVAASRAGAVSLIVFSSMGG